ncbi:MAG: cell division protein [Caulobacter sp.]|nr:cell division protein [Caulobacter sp.]
MSNIFTHRIRGFRTLNIVFGATLLVLAVSVNFAKVLAGRERNAIGQVEASISKEKARIRLLEAEVAHLEQPERLERLSRAYLAMAPVTMKQEATVETLPEVAGVQPQPQALTVSTVGVTVP